MKIVITGATGYLGRELIRQLANSNCKIFVSSSSVDKAKVCFQEYNVDILSNEDLLNDRGGVIDENCVIIHSAFCRRPLGSGLAQSLDFSSRLYRVAVENKAAGILNLSSQSVYGSEKTILGSENSEVSPGYLYAMAKYGSEELLRQTIYFSNGTTAGCNIRMASLMGPSYTVPENVLYKFICNALAGKDISIVGGTQKFSFLDVRDAAQAIIFLLKKKPSSWKTIYNLGPKEQTDILEMATLVRDEVEMATGRKVGILIQSDENHVLNAGMDSSLLYHDLGWTPHHNFADIVKDTVQFVREKF